MPLMVKVPHTSMKCCRCTFASSCGVPQNGLACTMLIRAGLSSNWAPQVDLQTHGHISGRRSKKSRIVFWAITFLGGGVSFLERVCFREEPLRGTRRRLVLLKSANARACCNPTVVRVSYNPARARASSALAPPMNGSLARCVQRQRKEKGKQ